MVFTGTIYAILDNEYFYIGSTTQVLETRICQHMADSKRDKFKNNKFYKYINEVRGNWDNIIYITLETLECETLKELKNKEYEYINKHKLDPYCLNVLRSEKQRFFITQAFKKKLN